MRGKSVTHVVVLASLIVALTPSVVAASMETIPLSQWSLYSTADTTEVYRVSAPNTVLGALLTDTNRYPFDPFYGKNLDLINRSDFMVPWVWSTTFSLPNTTATATRVVLLQLEGLNYEAQLTIDGVIAANSSYLVGAFRRYLLDITSFVASRWSSLHTITIEVTSQTHSPMEWRSFNADLSINFQDWNPHPADLSMGIYRSAQVLVVSSPDSSASSSQPLLCTVEGMAIKTSIPPSLPGQSVIALINASFVVQHWGATESEETYFYVDFGFNVTGANGTSQRLVVKTDAVRLPPSPAQDLQPSETRVYISWQTNSALVLENPPLWWPWQMGDQSLQAGAVLAEDGVTVLKSFTYGIRDVRTELNQGGSLQFFVNNIPLQFRGGGWNSDMFLRESSFERLTKELTMMREMGLNGLRLEGMLESDLFYELTDVFGLVLLPGLPCCDGWQNWSSWPAENYAIARRSIVDQARRLAIHPSVIGFFEASDSLPPEEVELMYLTAFVQESWPNALISSASQQVSNISGNPGVKMVGPYSWEPPTYWLVDGNGLADGNYGGAWGFFTEGGPGEAPMTFASWNRTVPSQYLWNDTTRALDSWWSYHMGEPWGHYRNLTYYDPPLVARYGASSSAEEYLYRAQVVNYEGMRAFMESYSRNKHRNATGFVQWMINSAWPSHLWHLYDWYLVAGGGYYGAKKACEDLHVMVSYTDGSVWVINSRFVDMGEVTISADVMNISGDVVWTQTQTIPMVPSDGSFPLDGIDPVPVDGKGYFTDTETFFVRVQWTYQDTTTTSGLRTRENWYWFNAQPDVLDFAATTIKTPCTSYTNFSQLTTGLVPVAVDATITSASAQQLQVLLTAATTNPVVAFFVHVRVVNTTSGYDIAPQYWDDNFVQLLPGASKTLTVSTILDVSFPLSDVRIEVNTWNGVVGSSQ